MFLRHQFFCINSSRSSRAASTCSRKNAQTNEANQILYVQPCNNFTAKNLISISVFKLTAKSRRKCMLRLQHIVINQTQKRAAARFVSKLILPNQTFVAKCSVTRKKSQNVYKSWPKKYFTRKMIDFDILTKNS